MKRAISVVFSEQVVLSVIIFNSLLLFMDAFVPFHTAYGKWFDAMDSLCIGYFVLEITLKIVSQGVSRFFSSGWNRFDFAVVFLSLPFLTLPFGQFSEFSFIIVLRLVRVLRYFRLLAFIPDQRHLALGIVRALKASLGFFLVVLLYNLILSLGAVYLFREAAPEFFRDPLMALYTTFRIFTNDGWHEIPELIAERSNEAMAVFARIYFVISVLSGGVLGLSLANAVFVDQMMTDNVNNTDDKLDRMERRLENIEREIKKIAGKPE